MSVQGIENFIPSAEYLVLMLAVQISAQNIDKIQWLCQQVEIYSSNEKEENWVWEQVSKLLSPTQKQWLRIALLGE